MKNEILNSLDVIQETCNETEVAVAEAIIQECYKAMDILEYSDTDVEQFNIIQEGKIMDDVKKQGEGQSKVMRILSFIPRLIAALFKAVSGKLQDATKSAKNVIQHTKGKDKGKMATFIDGLKKGDKKAVKTALIALGAVAGVAGGVGAGIAIKKKLSGNSDSFDMLKPCLSDEDFKEIKRISGDESPDSITDAKKAISILEKVDYSKLKQSEEKEKAFRERVDGTIEILKEYISAKEASTSNAEKKETPKTEEKPSADEKKESTPVNNEPENPIEFPTKMNKAIDDIMKQYSDLQNSGDVKLIDFIYNPHAGLEVAYNCSIWSICSSIADMGHHIINYPSKVEQYKSFLNSYSENVKKNRGKFRMMVSAIAACADNNIRPKEIKKDKLWSVIRTDGLYKDINDKAIKRFDDHHFKDAENDDLKNNTDAIKAINTISDCIRDVNTDVIAYITDIVDIITRLEDIFGYEKMWSHTDEESWKAAREVHKS